MSDLKEEKENNMGKPRTNTKETRNVPLQTGEEKTNAEKEAASGKDDSEKPKNS